ncbi:hypothetical protein ACI79D_23865 [Geodermatophilus sp. SYSU D00708]
MSHVLNGADQAWCDDLLLRLRMLDVPGSRIGEVLAEVQSHVAETGENPQQAFGTPKEYAGEVAGALGITTGGPWRTLRRGLRWSDLVVAVVTGLAAFSLADGLWSLGARETSLFGLPAWLVSAVAALVLACCTARFVVSARDGRSADRVLDPRTGADMVPFTRQQVTLLAGLPVLFLALMLVGGLLTR